MKRFLSVFAVSATLFFTSCTKEGPQGPQGPIGPQGPAGATGSTGPAGQNGTNGTNGTNGQTTLTKTTTLAVGSTECPHGGTKIEVGLDANNNGVLDASEVIADQTKVVCNGAPGTANVIYSGWYKFDGGLDDPQATVVDFNKWKDTALHGLNEYKRAIRRVPALTQEIISGAAILTYVKLYENHINLMPYRSDYAVTINNAQRYAYSLHNTIVSPGKLTHTTRRIVDNVFNPAENGIHDVEYRYVIIPGGTTGRIAGYTPAQLQAMPYDKVARILNIPATGTNMK